MVLLIAKMLRTEAVYGLRGVRRAYGLARRSISNQLPALIFGRSLAFLLYDSVIISVGDNLVYIELLLLCIN
jgi:hypothetical protein